MLDIRNLHKTFTGPQGKVHALTDLTVRVAAGEFVVVRGPSGSGKTTLLLAAGGLLHPDSGQVMVGGQDLYQLSSEGRARFRAANIGFVFQQFHLVPYLHILDNVLAPGVAQAGRGVRERGLDLIEQLGLGPRRYHLPSALSSGERQRAALARALLHRPALLLADEPTGNLDAANGQVVLDHLTRYVDQGGALLLVTHDDRIAGQAARVIHLGSATGGGR